MRTVMLLIIFAVTAIQADVIRLKNGVVIEDCTILQISDNEITYRDALGVRLVPRSEVEAFATGAQDGRHPVLVKKRSLRLVPVAVAMGIFSYATWQDAQDLSDDMKELKNAGIDVPADLETRRNRKRVVAVIGGIATAAITFAALQDVTVSFDERSVVLSYRF